MISKKLITQKIPFILFLAVMTASLLFTACSGNSKKQNKKENQKTVTTTAPQQTPEAPTSNEQTSDTTTNKTTEETQSTEPTKAQTNTSAAENITAAQGHEIIKSNGCLACHSTSGKKMAGPTFKNLYGRKTTLKNGKTITANSSYLTESIKDPGAKVVKGFAPVMPSFGYLKDDQIASIIAYIKSISE